VVKGFAFLYFPPLELKAINKWRGREDPLLKLNVASLLMSVALDDGPGPPIKYQYAELGKLYQVRKVAL
jgi:hypothetical protein